MKKLSLLLVIFLFLSFFPKDVVTAQSATDASWTSSITYYSTSSTPGSLNIVYYEGDIKYTAGPYTISPHGAGSVNIGFTSAPEGFSGSAMLTADVPIFATYVQFEKTSSTLYSRSFYSGFDETKAGSKFYLATVRSNGISTSTFGVQNVEEFEITAVLKFYRVGAVAPAFTHTVDILPHASFISSLPKVPGYPGGTFDGSLTIEATKKGDVSIPGKVVASAQETLDRGASVYSYEGVKEGSPSVYLPSAMCNRFGQTSFYAIQNAGTTTANVVIDYYDTTGKKVGSMPATNIAQGAKLSTNPCNNNLLVGQLGSAVVKSTNSVPLIAMGKIVSSDGLNTAFAGETLGSRNVVAPYVRWAANEASDWRSFLAIMNVSDVPAQDIVANYYDANGDLRASHKLATSSKPLAPYTKVNTNPSTAGALINGSFGFRVDGGANGGAVEIISDQPVVAVIRLHTYPTSIPNVNLFGEDYNGIAVIP